MKEAVKQFADLVVRPALTNIGLWSDVAEKLVLGTAAVESQFCYLQQRGGGPALGLYQMEPETHDCLKDWAWGRESPNLDFKFWKIENPYPMLKQHRLIYDLIYATQFCRLKYYSSPLPLPGSTMWDTELVDARLLGAYWKRIYNTEKGKGKVEDFVKWYQFFGIGE